MGVAAGVYLGYRHALHYSPGFYEQAMAVPVADQQKAGQEFERRVLALHNDMQEHDQWKHVFTAREINGWLAADLPRKFPELLPAEISAPRIALSPGQLQLAFRYDDGRVSTVINLRMDVGVAETRNTLTVRIRNARAGWIPLPLTDFLDQISQTAREADLMLRWAQENGDPVALVTIPLDHEQQQGREYVLETVEISQGELAIAGRVADERRQNVNGTVGESPGEKE
jgi:hypothetical protein